MNLYLVQHAEAKPKQEDPERPLSERGLAEIRTMAAYLAENTNVAVGQIRHSGKTRTQQTAEALAKALHPPDEIEAAADLAPMDEVSVWATRLAGMTDDLMLVGHLPHLSKLAALLLCQDETRTVIAFRMGGVVSLAQDDSGNWSVQWLITPDIV